MTVIAYRDGVLAADTRACMGEQTVGTVTKIARNDKGDLAGAAGAASYNHAFLRWFAGGEQGDAPLAKEVTNASYDRGVIFRRAGPIEVHEPSGKHEMRANYYALGSGRPEALGAMYAGATAEGAVRAAIAHDITCGGDITTLRHDQMTLDEAVTKFEAKIGSVQNGFPSALSETGEPYIQITSSGPRIEGNEYETFPSEAQAVETWLQAVERYAGDKDGTLYWRIRPTIETENGRFTVYSRLLISAARPDCVRQDADGSSYVTARAA